MKNLILTLCLILSCIATANAQKATATINNVWLEYDVTINNRKAMKVHCDFNVNNMLGKTGYMAIWVKGPSGNWHNINSTHGKKSGTPFFKKEYSPRHAKAHYKDFKYTIYLKDLNFLKGKNKYKIIVTIHNEDNVNIAQSKEISFNGTGASGSNSGNNNRNPFINDNNGNNSGKRNNNNYGNNNHNHNHNHNNSNVRTWREELGYGGFVIVKQYPSGGQQRTRYRLCPNCNGSTKCNMCLLNAGNCPFCEGKGYIVSAGYGTRIPCYNCMGKTGACALCGGTGECGACTGNGNEYPGYVIAATTFLDASGNVTSKEKVDYNGYGNDDNDRNGNRRNSGKQTCPDCGGTRLYHGGTSPEYAQPRSELVGVYHPSGSRCPHCNRYDEHWHSKCPTCKHYPGTTNPYR